MSIARNYMAVAMRKRYGQTTSVMKDRRAPRQGARNEERELLEEYAESCEMVREVEAIAPKNE